MAQVNPNQDHKKVTGVSLKLLAKLALEITQSTIVLNRGRISYLGESAALRSDSQRLTSLIVAA